MQEGLYAKPWVEMLWLLAGNIKASYLLGVPFSVVCLYPGLAYENTKLPNVIKYHNFIPQKVLFVHFYSAFLFLAIYYYFY